MVRTLQFNLVRPQNNFTKKKTKKSNMNRQFTRGVFPSIQRTCTACRNRSFVITNERGVNLRDFLIEARVIFEGKLNKILEKGPMKFSVEFIGSFKDDTRQTAGQVFHSMPAKIIGCANEIRELYTTVVNILEWKTGNGSMFPPAMVSGTFHFQFIVFVEDREP